MSTQHNEKPQNFSTYKMCRSLWNMKKFYDIESALRFVTASSSVSMNGCKILKSIRYGIKTMNTTQAPKAQPSPRSKSTFGRLFFLEVSTGRVLSANPDGSDRKAHRNWMPAPRWRGCGC